MKLAMIGNTSTKRKIKYDKFQADVVGFKISHSKCYITLIA